MVKMLHTCLRVKDLDRSLEFYKTLGLFETRRLDHSDKGFIIVYISSEVGQYEIELTYNIGSDAYEVGNGFSHIAIGVDDLESEQKRMKSLKYEVGELKGLSGNIPNYFFVTDPDGYKVEIIRNN
ncbi:MAG: VOC family protein [Lachnospirales bacterium]